MKFSGFVGLAGLIGIITASCAGVKHRAHLGVSAQAQVRAHCHVMCVDGTMFDTTAEWNTWEAAVARSTGILEQICQAHGGVQSIGSCRQPGVDE